MLHRLLPTFTIGALATALLVAAAPAATATPIPADTDCRNGSVSLTFDDGPSRVNTPTLLVALHRADAQATFFVQGKNAKLFPAILRAEVRDGHAVENHSWNHPDLLKRSSRQVKDQLSGTQAAIRKATGTTPHLFRPPYGDSDGRVRAIAKRQHLAEELWTIDTRDWSGISPRKIRRAALQDLRPHRSNVILMHDGVTSTPHTIAALPGIIGAIRARGYCLVPLERPTVVPAILMTSWAMSVDEGSTPSTIVPVTLTLDRPAARSSWFHVRTASGSAHPGRDFEPVDRTVRIRRGARSVTVDVQIHADPMPNDAKDFSLILSSPHALALSTDRVAVTITDNPSWSRPADLLIAPSPAGDP